MPTKPAGKDFKDWLQCFVRLVEVCLKSCSLVVVAWCISFTEIVPKAMWGDKREQLSTAVRGEDISLLYFSPLEFKKLSKSFFASFLPPLGAR